MEARDYLNQICVLKPEFLKEARACDKAVATKDHRPFLILELEYQGSNRLFAVPIQTSLKESLDKRFWYKLPSRLETEQNLSCALIYACMIPIGVNAILSKRRPDEYIPNDEKKQDILITNLITQQASAYPEKAREAFDFMKSRAKRVGMLAYGEINFQTAYKRAAREIYARQIEYKNKNLPQIRERAQAYLTNNYCSVLANEGKNKNEWHFVDMPERYTKINSLIPLADKYAGSGAGLCEKKPVRMSALQAD